MRGGPASAGPGFLVVLGLVGALSVSGASAQRNGLPPEPADIRTVFYEAVVFPAAAAGQLRVDILYRVDAGFFVAIRNDDPEIPHPFRRRGDVLVELIDSAGVSRARQIRQVEMGATAAGEDAPRWHTGSASFTVPPGRYTVALEIDDLASDRRFLERRRPVEARAATGDSARSEEVLLFSGALRPSDTLLVPQNFGGDVRFGGPGGIAVPFPYGDAGTFTYSIVVAEKPDERLAAVPETTAAISVVHGLPGPPDAPGDTLRYTVRRDAGGPAGLALIPLPFEALPLRTVLLEGRLTAGSLTTVIRRRFRLVWPEMPNSLRDVDGALSALRHIASPRVIDSLSSGPFETRRGNLEAFWKGKDPTPETALNEVMAVYYARVDTATRVYATLREPDGSRTDQGRIFILHGPPARIDRRLDPSLGFQETWTYTNPAKRFVFVDKTKSGTYVLVSSPQP